MVWEKRRILAGSSGFLSRRQNTLYSSLLEDYWPCAGEQLAVNAIGVPLLNPINSGLARGRLTLCIDAVIVYIAESMKERADAGRDGRTCLTRPNSQARTGTGKKIIYFPVQLTGNRTRLMPDLLHVMDHVTHTYIVPCSKKNLNASRPSEHPPVRGGGNIKTFRWDHKLQRQNLFMAFNRAPQW